MTDKQPEALQYANRDHMALGDYYLRHVSAMTGEALHAKSAIAAELAHRDREIDKLHAELDTLRTGYAAAQQGAAYAAQDSEHQMAIMQGERNASLDAYSRVAYLTGAESRLYEVGFTNGWDRRDRLASHGQAPAQAAPAAVAGPSGYGPKVTVKRRCSDCKACNSESYAVQGDSGHYVYCEHPSLPERKYIGDTHWDTPDWCPAAAPTTQPAPVVQLTSEQRLAMVVEMDAHDIVLAAIDAEAAAAQPAPQQEAQQQEVQEPVAWQSRTRQTWGGDTTPWSPWELCTKGQAEDYWKMPLLHDWAYEARALYTAPQPAPATQQAGEVAEGFFLLLPQRPRPDAPAGTAGLHWDAYSGAQMLAYGRDCSDAAIAAFQPSPAAQGDALDAERWRRLVNASELSFPVATIADDPENAAVMLYGRKAMEDFVDSMDEIPNTYDAARAAQEGK